MDKSKFIENFKKAFGDYELPVAVWYSAKPIVPVIKQRVVSWTLFDTNRADAVSVPFGSGCSSIISQIVVENKNNGNGVFLGFFDPSVRPQVERNILSFAIPMSRFRTMYYTFNDSYLIG